MHPRPKMRRPARFATARPVTRQTSIRWSSAAQERMRICVTIPSIAPALAPALALASRIHNLRPFSRKAVAIIPQRLFFFPLCDPLQPAL
jgi:hypothetical protein